MQIARRVISSNPLALHEEIPFTLAATKVSRQHKLPRNVLPRSHTHYLGYLLYKFALSTDAAEKEAV